MVMRRTIICLALLMCAACSSYSLKPYRMDIQQGNVVTSKMMLQLRPGMNKSQVRFIMGTPLIQDSFHRDRWDYFYQMRKDGKVVEQRRVILEFEGDALKRVRGDVIPAGTGDPAVASPTNGDAAKPAGKPQKEKSLMDKLKFWKSDEAAEQAPQSAPGELVTPAATPMEQAPAQSQPSAKPDAEPMSQPAAEPAAAPVQETAPAVTEAPAAATPDVTQNPPPVRQIEVPAEQPAPAAPAKPAAQAVPKSESKSTAAPANKPEPEEEDLPPEGEPGYFERMLEKIGF